MASDILIKIYQNKRTVFNLQEIALLIKEPDFIKLKQKINYYVRGDKLLNLRRGIYAKQYYSPEELACKIFKPSYISLEYVLQKEGIIFQYNSQITSVSYLTRAIEVDNNQLLYRKIKNEILYSNKGILNNEEGLNIDKPERAFLDVLYLNKEFHFDSIINLNKNALENLLPLYNSDQLNRKVQNIFKYA